MSLSDTRIPDEVAMESTMSCLVFLSHYISILRSTHLEHSQTNMFWSSDPIYSVDRRLENRLGNEKRIQLYSTLENARIMTSLSETRIRDEVTMESTSCLVPSKTFLSYYISILRKHSFGTFTDEHVLVERPYLLC